MSPVPAPARLPAETTVVRRSGAGTAVRSTALPRPAPSRPDASRPRLRLVDNAQVEVAVRRRRARRLLAAAGVVVVLAVLALAGVNAVLVSNQVRLDALDEQVIEAQARHQALRLEVATLEAPERVVAVATEHLGMVPPESVTYVQPASAGARPPNEESSAPPSSDDEAPTSSASSTSWGAVKPYLSR